MALAFWQRIAILNTVESKLTKPADLALFRDLRGVLADAQEDTNQGYIDLIALEVRERGEFRANRAIDYDVTGYLHHPRNPAESTIKARLAPYKRIHDAVESVAGDFPDAPVNPIEAALLNVGAQPELLAA